MDLKDKAINIKGKEYVQVKDRILYLADLGNPYSVETEYDYFPERSMWVVKAKLTIGENVYTGLAQEIESKDYKDVNYASALENCETSAVGRACAMAGIGVLDSIASADEIVKANNRSVEPKKTFPKPTYEPNSKEVLLWVDIPYSKENVAMIKTLEWAGWKDDRKQWRCADTPENREKLKNMKMIKTIHDNQGNEITL